MMDKWEHEIYHGKTHLGKNLTSFSREKFFISIRDASNVASKKLCLWSNLVHNPQVKPIATRFDFICRRPKFGLQNIPRKSWLLGISAILEYATQQLHINLACPESSPEYVTHAKTKRERCELEIDLYPSSSSWHLVGCSQLVFLWWDRMMLLWRRSNAII